MTHQIENVDLYQNLTGFESHMFWRKFIFFMNWPHTWGNMADSMGGTCARTQLAHATRGASQLHQVKIHENPSRHARLFQNEDAKFLSKL